MMLTTTDDRGNDCDMATLSPRQVGLRALGVYRLSDQHTQQERNITDSLEIAWAIGGGVAGAVAWQILHRLWPIFGTPGFWAGLIVFPVITAMITWRLTLGNVRRKLFGRLADIYLSEGRCAACNYALTGLTHEADGCVICPECGAAWNANRVGDSAQDATPASSDAEEGECTAECTEATEKGADSSE